MTQVKETDASVGISPLFVKVRLPGGGESVMKVFEEDDLAAQLGLSVPEGGFVDVVSACESAGLTVIDIRNVDGTFVYGGVPEGFVPALEEQNSDEPKPENWKTKALAGALIAVFAGWMVFHAPAQPLNVTDPVVPLAGASPLVLPEQMTMLSDEPVPPIVYAPAVVPVTKTMEPVLAIAPPPAPLSVIPDMGAVSQPSRMAEIAPMPRPAAATPALPAPTAVLDGGVCPAPELLAYSAAATR